MNSKPATVLLLVTVFPLAWQAEGAILFDTPVVTLTNAATPSISANGLSLYFARFNAQGDPELYVTTRASLTAEWGPAINLGTHINRVPGYDGQPKISSDERALYFADGGPFGLPLRPGGLGGSDLWVATRDSVTNAWKTPGNVGAPVNSSSDEYYPSPSFDGLSLYFASTRSGGGGGSADIWVATRPTVQDLWGNPSPLGPPVNSASWEGFPMLSSNELVLMFYSDRSGGRGFMDLWLTTRTSVTNRWAAPVNLGPTFNGPYYDNAPTFSADFPTPGSKLYFSRNNASGFGGVYTTYAATVLSEPGLRITREADSSIGITWPESPSGFTLQSTAALPGTHWVAVPGVQSNRVTIAPAGTKQFYRLVKP